MKRFFKPVLAGVAAVGLMLSTCGAATAAVSPDNVAPKAGAMQKNQVAEDRGLLTPDASTALEAQSASIPSSQPMADYPARDILAWGEGGARNYPIRRGFWDSSTGKGFGYDKVYHKHGIHRLKTMSWVMGSPNVEMQGTQRVTKAWSQEYRCSDASETNCYVEDEVEVKSVTETAYKSSYYGQVVNGKLGLMTVYCVTGKNLCPSWVNKTPKLASAKSDPDGPVYRTGISYQPLGKGTRLKKSDLVDLY